MTQLLSWLDLERNAEILEATDKKIAAKAKANRAAQSLIRNAAQVALGEDTFALTDTEVDDLLGVSEISNNGLFDYYDYDTDYDVDLEDILVDYVYEYGLTEPFAYRHQD